MIPRAWHESRFGAQAHEARRGGVSWPAHELRRWLPSWRAQWEPRPQLRHVPLGDAGSLTDNRLEAGRDSRSHQASGVRPRASLLRLGNPRQAARLASGSNPAARRGPVSPDHGRGHHRAFIHIRHLVRVRYQQELRAYHLELRRWRHLLLERAILLRKLASHERRLARRALQVAPRRHLPLHIYAIDGTWFRQAGRRRAMELRAP